MKTFNRNTVPNIKQAKKQAKQLRDLRKRGGNVSLFEGSGEPKQSFSTLPRTEGCYWHSDSTQVSWDE